jgi:hypothetical protein
MSLNLTFSNRLIQAFLSTLLLCAAAPSYARDEITFTCSAIGNGYQSEDKTGPWRHELGGFVWQYDASMLTPKPKVKIGDTYGCEPVDIESPKIYLEKDKHVYITGHRCGDSPSYFFAVTNISGLNMHYALGYVEDVFRNKEVRIIFDAPNDAKIKLKDKEFHDVYFDCHPK